VRTKNSDPKVRDLHDLEGRQFLAMIFVMIGIVAVIVGSEMLRKSMDVALSQVGELTDRVEHLSESTSEPAKT
jgi:hypothetical protein